ncbi:MAG: hypothetical protein M3R38_15680 [Actinomycetota bacterium]|nr:hypothetical protein [Actinomycetota bacterium]
MSMEKRVSGVEVVFCTDTTYLTGQDVPDEHREYHMFMHEAEVFMWALAGAVEQGKTTPEEALELWKPYQDTWALNADLLTEFDGGFPSTDWLMDQAPGPGSESFWRAASGLGIPGVFYDESNHPGGWPTFEIHGRRAVEDVCEALNKRYKVVVLDRDAYDTSGSSDLGQARRIIERGHRHTGVSTEKRRRWSETFRRRSTLDETKPVFSIKGTMEHLFDEYSGGHDDLDCMIELCEKLDLPNRRVSEPSTAWKMLNSAEAYEDHYDFLDGGLRILSGNYFFQERGAYIEGLLALRWMLHNLGYTQPRKLKGEEHVPSRKLLEKLVAEQAGA